MQSSQHGSSLLHLEWRSAQAVHRLPAKVPIGSWGAMGTSGTSMTTTDRGGEAEVLVSLGRLIDVQPVVGKPFSLHVVSSSSNSSAPAIEDCKCSSSTPLIEACKFALSPPSNSVAIWGCNWCSISCCKWSFIVGRCKNFSCKCVFVGDERKGARCSKEITFWAMDLFIPVVGRWFKRYDYVVDGLEKSSRPKVFPKRGARGCN